MKVWKVQYDGESQYASNEDVAKTYVVGNLALLSLEVSGYVDGKMTTEELRSKLLDFVEFGLPEQVEIEEKFTPEENTEED